MSKSVSTDIDETVNGQLSEFIDAITASNQYEQFVASQQQLECDDEAQRLLSEFQQKQQQLQENGFDQATMQDLRDLQEKMDDNKTISELREAETALIELLEETNEIVSERIGQEFAQTTGGGCC